MGWRADVFSQDATSAVYQSEQFQILRDGNVLGITPAADFAFNAIAVVTGASLLYAETPTSGSHTYKVQYKTGSSGHQINARNRSILLVELRR